MPRDANGNTNPLPGTIVATGDTILPSQHNPALVDLYAMMTQSLSRDGQGGMRANLNMNGFQVDNLPNGVSTNNAATVGQVKGAMPVGSVVDYAGIFAPDTWMFSWGQAISRSSYPDLFAAIGTAYGAGNGTTTFNLPDYRGRVGAGLDNMGGSDAARLTPIGNARINRGGSGGQSFVSLSIDQMPAHNHGGTTSPNGLHQHSGATFTTGGAGAGLGMVNSVGNITGARANIVVDAAGQHQHLVFYEGGGQSHTNVQPVVMVNKIIKVSY